MLGVLLIMPLRSMSMMWSFAEFWLPHPKWLDISLYVGAYPFKAWNLVMKYATWRCRGVGVFMAHHLWNRGLVR